MAVDRIERVDSLLKRVIAEAMFSVMQGDTVAPGLITVTDVHCGKDLRDATVKVSVFGDDALKETALQHLVALFKRAVELEEKARRELQPHFPVDDLLEAPRIVFKVLERSLLKRVIAEAMFSVMQGDTVAPGLITVTDVHCGKDLRDATVKVSVFGDDALKETALQHLKHNARRFQQIINREVRLKFTPRLLFQLDRSLEKGDEVLAILDKLGNG